MLSRIVLYCDLVQLTQKSSVAHQTRSAMLDFTCFCMDLFFSVGTICFSCMKNREKDAKDRAASEVN